MKLLSNLFLKIRYKWALRLRTLAFWLGLDRQLLRNRYGERIVVFHGIVQTDPLKYNSRFSAEDYLDAFLAYGKKHFHFLSVKDYFQGEFVKGKLNVALTFDDGYLNNWLYVLPILRKYNIPASFYITTIHREQGYLWPDFIDIVTKYTSIKRFRFLNHDYIKKKKGEFISDWGSLKDVCKTLTHSQITQLYEIFADDWNSIKAEEGDFWELMEETHWKAIADDPLFTIGAHGQTHASLTDIPLKEARDEMLYSRTYLEEICGVEIEEFAFPFGHYNQDLIAYGSACNYQRLLLVDYNDPGDRDNAHSRKRFVINPHIPLNHQIACLLKGSYF